MEARKPPILESLAPFARILFSVLLVIACFATAFLAGILLAGPLFGLGFKDLDSAMSGINDPRTVSLLKYFQVIQSVGLFIIPPLLAGFFFERSAFGYLLLDKPSRLPVYLLTLVLMFVSLPFINWMLAANESMSLPGFLKGVEDWMKATEEAAARLTDSFMEMPALGGLFFNLVMIALLPAIGEEFLFRGLLQRLLKEWLGNIHVAIFISALLFSAMHMQFYGFFPRTVLGIIFGYLFYWSGSLWVPVFGHFINNGAAVVFSYLGQHGVLNGDYEDFGATENVFLIILSALAIVMAMIAVYRLKPVKHIGSVQISPEE